MTAAGVKALELLPGLVIQTKFEPKIQEHVSCGCCGSDQYETVHHFPENYFDPEWFDTYSWDANLGLELRIVECKDCGLIYQNKRFSQEALHQLYPNTYIPTKINKAKEMANHKFAFHIDWIKKHMGNKKNPSLLDVGTRYGVLPNLLRREKIDAFGIEMNLKCVQAAGNSGMEEVYLGTVDSLNNVMNSRTQKQIDAVAMFDLIEHLLDPKGDLEEIAKFQPKGGKLFISTMDISSMGYKVFGKDWYYLHGQHTFYFTPQTITKLLESAGYRVVSIDRFGAMKSLRHLPGQIKKWMKYQWTMRWGVKGEKEWFAKHRPHLLDTMNIVAEKI
ncbi:class I SAM-dependent methyltransferase [Sanyastnella coralliicola]|uniref:class I SAM-dependent methyltransferase n=1 Tax=Sanyastnella coralliicola TaxID=3069118 RepID=UPI0027BA2AC3|nr:class I SAM-dependent methyltransferase [Longitalea sp. SCSIO 12813]